MANRSRLLRIGLDIFGVVLSAIVLVPFYFVIVNSFKTSADAAQLSLGLPQVYRIIDNYRDVFVQGYLLTAFKNSVLVTGFSNLMILVFAAMGAFIIQRRNDKLTRFAWSFILMGLIMPPSMVTTTLLIKYLGLTPLPGVTFVFAAIQIPLAVFIYRSFYRSIPRELDEAAILDGCGLGRLYFQIVFPLIKPVTMTVFVLSFMEVWNNFSVSLYFLSSVKNYTMPITVYFFFGQYSSSWNLVFADVVLVALPIIIVYIFAQKFIISGMVEGSVKG